MYELSSEERQYALREKLTSSQCYSFTKVTYFDDDGTEVVFEDAVYPIVITQNVEKPIYASINLAPAASTVSFNVINQNGEYSPNAEGQFAGILEKGRRFRIYDGKRLKTSTYEDTESATLANGTFFYTEMNGGNVVLSVTNSITDNRFTDLFDTYYDDGNYGDDTYTPAGYYAYTFDRYHQFVDDFESFSVTCNSTLGRVYYRVFNDTYVQESGTTSSAWTYVGATVNGTQEYVVGVSGKRYIEVAVVYDAGSLGDSISVSDITLIVEVFIEWVLLGEFLLDTPQYEDKPSPEMSIIQCEGRNSYKRALESEINLQDLSTGGGTTFEDLILEVCEQAGIDCEASYIDEIPTTTYPKRQLSSGYGKSVRVDKVFTDIMQIIGADFRMFMTRDNKLYVREKETAVRADWVFDYRNYKKAKQLYQFDK